MLLKDGLKYNYLPLKGQFISRLDVKGVNIQIKSSYLALLIMSTSVRDDR